MASSNRSFIFTVSTYYWMVFLAAPALILGLIGLLLFTPGRPLWIVAMFFAAAVMYPLGVWWTQRRNRVDVLPDRLRARFFRYEYELFWADVLAVSHTRAGLQRGITFYLADGSEVLAGRFFDYDRLLHQVQSRLPLAVQDPLAYQRLAPYQTWRSAMSARFAVMDGLHGIDIGFGQRMISLALLAAGGWSLWRSVSGGPGWMYTALPVLGLGIWLLVESFQWLSVDGHEVSIATLFGSYALEWTEVQKIVFNPETHTYVLMNKHTRLVLPTPLGWVGRGRKDALEWIRFRIHTSGIVPLDLTRAAFLRNHQYHPRHRRRAALG